MTDQPETDRGNRRTQKATRKRVNNRRRKDHRKDRQCRVGEGAQANGGDGNAGDKAFGTRGVHQRATRHLSE